MSGVDRLPLPGPGPQLSPLVSTPALAPAAVAAPAWVSVREPSGRRAWASGRRCESIGLCVRRRGAGLLRVEPDRAIDRPRRREGCLSAAATSPSATFPPRGRLERPLVWRRDGCVCCSGHPKACLHVLLDLPRPDLLFVLIRPAAL